jgi:hypothetical protein
MAAASANECPAADALVSEGRSFDAEVRTSVVNGTLDGTMPSQSVGLDVRFGQVLDGLTAQIRAFRAFRPSW